MRTSDQQAAIICDAIYHILAEIECAEKNTLLLVATELSNLEATEGWEDEALNIACDDVYSEIIRYVRMLSEKARI